MNQTCPVQISATGRASGASKLPTTRLVSSADVEDGRAALAAASEAYEAAGYVWMHDQFAKDMAEADRILAKIKNQP